MLKKLLDMGAKSAVITSLPLESGLANVYMRRGEKPHGPVRLRAPRRPLPRHRRPLCQRAHRRAFARDALEGAVRRATDFTRLCVERSMRFPTPVNYGVDLEPLLPLLWEDAANRTRE